MHIIFKNMQRVYILSIAILLVYVVILVLYRSSELDTFESSALIFEPTRASSQNFSVVTDLETFCPGRTTLPGLCRRRSRDAPRCIMTINALGRLGNLMGEYATLYALARWNNRPAFMVEGMSNVLRQYFQVTMPQLEEPAEVCLEYSWTTKFLNDWMNDSYKSFEVSPDQPILLTGYPCSWTFFHHVRDEILREFALKEHIAARAQKTLRSLLGKRSSATFVGVHARRSDYVKLMDGKFRGVVADAEFFAKAMAHFRSRHTDSIFVVTSDDMDWCRNNMDTSLGDVYFAGAGDIGDPINDFALLSQCNHSIITIGTFGFWVAYLAGGDTVYLTNYTLPDSPFLRFFRYETAYLPNWIPIAANLSGLAPKIQILSTILWQLCLIFFAIHTFYI